MRCAFSALFTIDVSHRARSRSTMHKCDLALFSLTRGLHYSLFTIHYSLFTRAKPATSQILNGSPSYSRQLFHLTDGSTVL